MNDEIDSSFFDFKQPLFGGISSRLFNAIKNGTDCYRCCFDHTDVCVKPENLSRHKLANLLASKRDQYYGFGG